MSDIEKLLRDELDIILEKEQGVQKSVNFKNKQILVLSGGGMKGLVTIGALHALDTMNYLSTITTYAGTSVGALLSLLLNVGYSPHDIHEVMQQCDLLKLKSMSFDNLFTQFGLDNGNQIEKLLKVMIKSKGFNENITFKDLYDKTNKKIIMVATCINTKKAVYLSHETFPHMPVLKAARMSISIPFYFIPVEHEGKLYIDGGCIDNYPIQLFSDQLDNVIGIYLSDIRNSVDSVANIEDFLSNLIQSLLEGVTVNSIKGYEKCTVRIDVSDVGIMSLDIDSIKKQNLFDSGFKAIDVKKS